MSASGAIGVSRPPRPTQFRMRWARSDPSARAFRRRSFASGTAAVGLVDPGDAARVAADYGLSIASVDGALHALELRGTPARLEAAARAVAADARLRYVEPVRPRQVFHARNDPLTTAVDPATGRPYEWQFAQVRVDRALNVSQGSPQILVGVIDTGVPQQSPDLVGKIAQAWYWANETSNAYDTMGHGTFVSSLIASANDDGRGMAGFCGSCRLSVFKNIALTDYSSARSIQWLTDNGARIINMSYGASSPSSVEADAVNYAINRGVLLVASSGNDSAGAVSYPAAYLQGLNGQPGWGLAVGASDVNNNRAYFSNWGSRLSLLAPGSLTGACRTGVLGALPAPASLFDGDACMAEFRDAATGARYAYSEGTSFAAPEVAGIAALVWAARPDLTNAQLANVLEQSADRPAGSGWAPDRGWGVVNAARAVELATGRSSADSIALTPPVFGGRVEGGSTASAWATARWQDGVAVASGSVVCEASAGGEQLPAATQTVAAGAVSCGWNVPARRGGSTLVGTVRVTAEGVSAAQPFQQAIADVTEPNARALPSKGRWGARIALRYRVGDETGRTREQVRVYRGSTSIFQVTTGVRVTSPSRTYTASWQAPLKPLRGSLRFCVRAWDATGNLSERSCASLSVRS
jgi:hypothetical protein